MVISPDFENLQSPRSDEGVILGPNDTLNTYPFFRVKIDPSSMEVTWTSEKASEEEGETITCRSFDIARKI
ncbi:hypothetical protein Avbf_18062 [Armadillidium vulgare]|nr:hypothetical protein Avbf_18062 [Armadillidium vulgare]